MSAPGSRSPGSRSGPSHWKANIQVSISGNFTALSEENCIQLISMCWSNTTNPNGPWSYLQGNVALPLVPNWTGGGSGGCNQPAWAPSNNVGNFLPAFMQVNACESTALGTDPNNGLADAMPGDIVVHTVDPFNGSPGNGVANFRFTLPSGDNGEYAISGSVWDADLFYGTARPQDWELLVNGINVASGLLSGSISRSEAETFGVLSNLTAGEIVDLELFEAPGAAAGFFVGTNLNIVQVSVPEPSTFALLAIGLLVLGSPFLRAGRIT